MRASTLAATFVSPSIASIAYLPVPAAYNGTVTTPENCTCLEAGTTTPATPAPAVTSLGAYIPSPVASNTPSTNAAAGLQMASIGTTIAISAFMMVAML